MRPYHHLRGADSMSEHGNLPLQRVLSLVRGRGGAVWVAVTSRPDIAFHTSILAKFLSDPSLDAWKAAVELLQYLQATKKKRLFFSGVA